MKAKHVYTVIFHEIDRRVVLGASNEKEAVETARKTFKKVVKQEYNGEATAYLHDDLKPNV